ncbi:MAG TPA: hypothetical protein VLT35_07895 [Methanocella sp.]|nr:hypothetical protein [Methanocella sp.]
MAKLFNSPVLMLVYGFLLWLTTFIVSWILKSATGSPGQPTEVTYGYLAFESLIPVALAALTLWFSYLYFKGMPGDFAKAGLLAGVVWMVVNVLLDQLLFAWGPMQMPFERYVYDIGLTYLMIPVITAGAGYLMDRARATVR